MGKEDIFKLTSGVFGRSEIELALQQLTAWEANQLRQLQPVGISVTTPGTGIHDDMADAINPGLRPTGRKFPLSTTGVVADDDDEPQWNGIIKQVRQANMDAEIAAQIAAQKRLIQSQPDFGVVGAGPTPEQQQEWAQTVSELLKESL
jgi:hypothetical protein